MATHKMPDGSEYDEDDLSVFAFIPGRYYVEQCCIRIPNHMSKFGKGGDVTTLLWRKENEPTKWVFQYRFRQYRTAGAWDGKDEKRWFAIDIEGEREEEVVRKTHKVLDFMAAASGSKVGVFSIKGDHQKFYEQFEKNPPVWLHAQQMVQE